MKNKFLKPALALVLVAAMAVGGSLAYITSTSEVKTNEFIFASNDTDTPETDDEILKVQLEEVYPDSTFLPGEELFKTATVTLPVNELTDGAYVFVKVTDTDTNEILNYSVDTTKWTQVTGTTDVWYYTDGAQTGMTFSETVLTDNVVTVVDDAEMTCYEAAVEGAVEIEITAYAIQAANFASADAAWTAFTA